MAGLITRFAPSPTGPLHLGHAFSALTAYDLAKASGGRFLLRIEDIDVARCRSGYEAQIFADLAWLGLDWETPVTHQSHRQPAYDAALAQLEALGVTYACTCHRRDIQQALSAPQEGSTFIGPDGPIYPGLCREKSHPPKGAAIRLNMAAATQITGAVTFDEMGPLHTGPHKFTPEWLTTHVGDVVLARRDIGTSYHLSVTVDDAAQGVTLVVRGDDLFSATPVHAVLQRLLGFAPPRYHHHQLIRDDVGKRLAKRDDSRALSLFRADGSTPADIRRMVGL